MENIGIHTIGDAAGTPPEILQSILGEKAGLYIWNSANGRASDVIETERGDAKSYSNETTTAYDITEDNYAAEIDTLLEKLGGKVASRIKRDNTFASTVAVIVKTSDFQKRSIQTKLPNPTQSRETIISTARNLMDRLMLGEKGLFREVSGIRLVGVKATDLSDGDYHQISLADFLEEKIQTEKKEKEKRLAAMADKLKEKYGADIIRKGYQS